MAAEAGHHPGRPYFAQDGSFHLNGGAVFDAGENNVTDAMTLANVIGASTAAAGSTTADAGVLPAATAKIYPTSAADDTKGVRIHANDQVTGRVLFIANGVANKVLKVYPPTGGAINGASADAAFSSVSGKGVIAICLDAANKVWAAW